MADFSPTVTEPYVYDSFSDGSRARVAIPVGECINCRRHVWSNLDGDNDPRGALGLHTVYMLDAEYADAGLEETANSYPQPGCWNCMNNRGYEVHAKTKQRANKQWEKITTNPAFKATEDERMATLKARRDAAAELDLPETIEGGTSA